MATHRSWCKPSVGTTTTYGKKGYINGYTQVMVQTVCGNNHHTWQERLCQWLHTDHGANRLWVQPPHMTIKATSMATHRSWCKPSVGTTTTHDNKGYVNGYTQVMVQTVCGNNHHIWQERLHQWLHTCHGANCLWVQPPHMTIKAMSMATHISWCKLSVGTTTTHDNKGGVNGYTQVMVQTVCGNNHHT